MDNNWYSYVDVIDAHWSFVLFIAMNRKNIYKLFAKT